MFMKYWHFLNKRAGKETKFLLGFKVTKTFPFVYRKVTGAKENWHGHGTGELN